MKIIFQEDDGTVIRTETITDEEHTAMLTDMIDITEWISNAFREKARRRIDDIVTRSGQGSKHTENAIKLSIIADLKKSKHPLLKTAKVKEAEMIEARKKERNQ